MKLKEIIATGLTAVTLLGTATTTVSAAKMQLAKKAYVYNVNGKRTKKHYAKNKSMNVIGKKKIKGRKFYQIGKNKYILVKNFSRPIVLEKPIKQPGQPTQEPAKEPWQSKHLVDNEVGLVAQIKKAFTLQGDDKLEAYKEIAVQMNMTPDSVTALNQKDFEQKLQNYANSMDSAKNVIEQGGK
ncbi:SLAP domain-containing protein [Lactobacillus sp.]|uniref:SLAP domain-containing protein n=1 Tax=Lactobacillus sp. TaxID=1591 RepID=UPI0025CEEDC7|nr:SLAP domain-containing protein [Lactobacillus sp.]MCO6535747.1 SLAP domain-containing protein [Lactobacillus sp.]MCO6548601.1 SLAP domain-containing protein [Gilliamella sp.]